LNKNRKEKYENPLPIDLIRSCTVRDERRLMKNKKERRGIDNGI
jgi:hypothetical protein